MNKKIIMVIGVIILFLVIGCSKEAIQITPEGPEDTIQPIDLEGTIQTGDIVEMDFVLYGEDGRIVDTNNEETAKQAGLTTYLKGPYKFIVGQSEKVKGFDEALIGLKKGDKETLEITASEKKLVIGFNRTKIESRINTIQRKQRFPLKGFETTFKKPPIINDIVANWKKFPWAYKVLAITNNSVLGEIVIREGDEVQLPGNEWPSKAIGVSDMVIQFIQKPKQGQIIETEFGTAVINVSRSLMKTFHMPEMGKEFIYELPTKEMISPRYEFKVTEINDNTFKISRINHLPQEDLKLEVEILDVISFKDIKKVR